MIEFTKKEEIRIEKMRDFENIDISKIFDEEKNKMRENITIIREEKIRKIEIREEKEITLFLQIVGNEEIKIWKGSIERKIWEVIEEKFKISLKL